ncbi:MAG: 50S ribosomal protein L34e [Nanoarchaeota archaeon]|nr:50S ribosomal protein L34e [Nanoarchaeota archaeon]
MVQPRLRSRSLRRVKVRTPSKTVTHFKREKPKVAHCGKCGAKLKGVVRARPYKMQNMPKTKKRPERPYGGVLCSACMRKLFIEKAR